MSRKKLGLASIVVVAILALAYWLKGELAIDACLDGGGRWDYSSRKCESGK
jgi:hypothetical protein